MFGDTEVGMPHSFGMVAYTVKHGPARDDSFSVSVVLFFHQLVLLET